MQTYIVEKTDDSVTLAFKDANLTLITPLMDELYKDDNPASATYGQIDLIVIIRQDLVRVTSIVAADDDADDDFDYDDID